AGDGIRAFHVTGVQTCALPILRAGQHPPGRGRDRGLRARDPAGPGPGGVPRYAGGTDRGRPRHHGRGRADRARVYRHPARRPRRSAGVSAARRAGSGATRHVLRTELRRSTAGVAAVATLALGASLLVAEASSWAGRWMGLAAAVRFSTLLLAPAAVALGVWQGGRERRRRIGGLLASTPRPRWQPSV